MTALRYKNALVIGDENPKKRLDAAIKWGAERVTFAAYNPREYDGNAVEAYQIVDNSSRIPDFHRIFLPSVEIDDEVMDAVIAHVLSTGAKLTARAAVSLEEVGRIDARFGFGPVMLLHRLGILEGATVAGGVYLDKDDMDIMRQSGASVVLCPSSDMGAGYGFPPVTALINKGIDVSLGSGDNRYNEDADMLFEARLLHLANAANMSGENPGGYERILDMITIK